MKSAEDGSSNDLTEPLDRTDQRRILGQGKVWPHVVVVGSISLEDPAQMVLAQDYDVVQALPSDRADQPLRMPILPGGARRDGVIPDAHRRHPSPDKLAVACIAVADEMIRRLVPREGLGD